MFYNCSSLILLPDISKWNSNIDDLSYIINDSPFLISLPDIKRANTKYTNMSSMNERNSTIVKLIFESKGGKILKIFDTIFIIRNKNKCKMIINNKLHSLRNIYQLNENNNRFLKIKLVMMNNVKIDLSFMLFDCSSLKEFSMLSTKENNISKKEFKDDIRENQIESPKIYDPNNQSYHI